MTTAYENPAIFKLLANILNLADRPGTPSEGEVAKAKAAQIMAKYDISHEAITAYRNPQSSSQSYYRPEPQPRPQARPQPKPRPDFKAPEDFYGVYLEFDNYYPLHFVDPKKARKWLRDHGHSVTEAIKRPTAHGQVWHFNI